MIFGKMRIIIIIILAVHATAGRWPPQPAPCTSILGREMLEELNNEGKKDGMKLNKKKTKMRITSLISRRLDKEHIIQCLFGQFVKYAWVSWKKLSYNFAFMLLTQFTALMHNPWISSS